MLAKEKLHPSSINQLLRDTARSFYLTFQMLPNAVRWPLSIGYLLARATDTVADVIKLPAAPRLSALNAMHNMITSKHANMAKLQEIIRALSPKSAEFRLLSSFNIFIDTLNEFDEETVNDIQQALGTIIQGQRFDIEHFSSKLHLICLDTKKELDQYTYQVAGCVGEFWTKVCERKIKNYSRMPLITLLPLAIQFGKGLQLINILRDIPADMQQGRCYLPLEQLQEFGLNQENIRQHPEYLAPVVTYWLAIAIQDLKDGWQYLLTLNNRRIRAAIALPLLLGFATLSELQDTRYLGMVKPIKIKRSKLYMLLLISLLSMVTTKFFYLLRFFSFSTIMDE